jgi:hypothetical protein
LRQALLAKPGHLGDHVGMALLLVGNAAIRFAAGAPTRERRVWQFA